MIGGYIGSAKSENFKDLAVTKLTNHELRERLLQANPDEPDIDGFVYGEQAVAEAAGYRNVYGPGIWCDGSILKRSGSLVQA